MKEIIPRQLYEVAIQAALGTKVVARETVPALRKTSRPSVTAGTSRGSGSSWRSRRKGRGA